MRFAYDNNQSPPAVCLMAVGSPLHDLSSLNDAPSAREAGHTRTALSVVQYQRYSQSREGTSMIAPRILRMLAGLTLLTMLVAGCGTLTGAAVGAGSGAAIGAGTGNTKKGALIGTGVGAAAGAVYDATR